MTNDKPPTDSHALATANVAMKDDEHVDGYEPEALDVGWHDHTDNVAQPLIEGVDNNEMWMLVRRFNKQLFRVRAVNDAPGSLDLHTAAVEEFAPEKMRASVERLYMTAVVGFLSVSKHMARLRSWNETRRTSIFCTIYFGAWLFDMLMPVLFAILIVLIVCPPSRAILFPPIPLALVDMDTGLIQRPRAGGLGSSNTLTGAPEKNPGEAVEQEASNFVTGVASIAISSASEASSNDNSVLEDVVPDTKDVTTTVVDAQQTAAGDPAHVRQDKTKAPMHDVIVQQARPVMQLMTDICDTWERVGNALSPTPPFPRDLPRYKLAAIFVPLLIVSVFVNSVWIYKGTTFGVGAFFFGWPLIWRLYLWLNTHYPKWQRILEIRNTLLHGVPTNAQLTITLLRVGEARKEPLPPPPISTGPPSSRTVVNADELPVDITQEEVDAATAPPQEQEKLRTESKRKRSRLLGMLRSTARTAVTAALGADHIKAAAGAEHARNRLGILPRHPYVPRGPVDFSARYHGTKGRVFLLTSATTPCVSFSVGGSDLKPLWSVAVEDIVELRKVGGLGWKAKLVVGWAMEREVADTLQIVDRQGNMWTLTAMQMRDELFNRLVAMGTQRWEVC